MNIGARTAMWSGKRMPTAKDYVQDGLIAMWDGIENAGWEVHDTNATVWKDLVYGRSVDIVKLGIFTNDSFLKTNAGSFGGGFGLTFSYIETVIRDRGSSGWIVPISSESTDYVSIKFSDKRVFFGMRVIGNVGILTSLSSISAESSQIRINGVAVENNYYDYWSASGNNTFFACTVGHSSQNTKNYEVCSIKLYSRVLSAKEKDLNYAIDKARFGLP